MQLENILSGVAIQSILGDVNVSVNSLCLDSRKIAEGDVFFALRGFLVDGHDYIAKAIALGANTIVCEDLPDTIIESVVYLKVDNVSEAMGIMVGHFYGNPSSKLKLVGVTGTNGKTSVVSLLFNLFRKLGYKVGMLSTVHNVIEDRVIPSTHTTPDLISLTALLDEMVKSNCTHCFMEVSSHAIHQGRINGLTFTGGVFTNLSHDHLDYHKTFLEYRDAKKAFFDKLPIDAFALINKDDKNGKVMVQNCSSTKYSYALKSPSDFKVKVLESDFEGMLLNMDGLEAWFSLMGEFNAYNLLAAYAVAFLLGEEKEEVVTALSALEGAKGRFETLKSSNNIYGVVDYAHTPDALENILSAINKVRTKNEKLITVVGCGGNRDKEKRPVMGGVAARLSDKVIFTSDNPRGEDPDSIIEAMNEGVDARDFKKLLTITNRADAIKTAVHLAESGDIILVAGKGHENYQEVNGVKVHFDDKEELIKNFNLINS